MKTILAVDDSPANLTIVREVLKEKYKVNVVTSGEQALKFLEKKDPDLILLDVCMPVMDGIETMKHINEMPGPARKVIFLTALTDAALAEQAKELNCVGFVSKPFAPAELISAIVSVIGE
ncbi:MAG: response regulator [Lachnospiraceae bacterium]|nr:response regulator [Lachnospiraceae bacterium]MCR5769449.1 response regulator [Lachnospiraceae bacterium]